MPQYYRDRIEFANPITLEETIRMVVHCYEQFMGRSKMKQSWKGNIKARVDII